ncbi:MAG: endolytic transglycosylase MltG [Alphaproteobacteria bacterium]|nr:endolytic transglycosylase MltG [Alphaproteobacteria bacterium]
MGRIVSGLIRLLRPVAVVGIIASCLVAAGGWMVFTAPGPGNLPGGDEAIVRLDEAGDNPQIVMVEQGTGLAAIAAKLEEQGLISNALVFRLGVMLSGQASALKAGEFEVPRRASMAEIMRLLVEGRSILHRITIAEGLTVAKILRQLDEHPQLSGTVENQPEEGRILPETYLFTRGTTRAELVARMVADHDAVLDALWETRQEGLPLATKEEAVILASIVEKETGIASERPRVAAVFINRLRRGMKLQSDPTIIYGITQGEPLGRGIRASELRGATPYNTYVIDGLPPTPIANPGRAALEAVLNPPKTDELYFVADGTGGHAFASTFSEHQRNVKRWRRIERQRAER